LSRRAFPISVYPSVFLTPVGSSIIHQEPGWRIRASRALKKGTGETERCGVPSRKDWMKDGSSFSISLARRRDLPERVGPDTRTITFAPCLFRLRIARG